MVKPLPLSKRVARIEKQIDKLAYQICEVDFDMDMNSPNNRKYVQLREELRDLEKQKQDLSRTFSAHWY